MSNVPSDTGFAWNNINRLFDKIAVELAGTIPVFVSFPVLRAGSSPLPNLAQAQMLELSPDPRSGGEFFKLLNTIRNLNIRAIYLTDQKSFRWDYPLLRLAGVRVIIIHNRVSVPDPNPASPDALVRRLAKSLVARLPAFSADSIYAVSEFVRERLILKNRVPSGKVHKILNGVDLRSFHPNSDRIEDERVKIVSVGRASKFKGIQVLIRASALLRDEYGIENFQVTFAGNGPDLDNFQTLTSQLELGSLFRFVGEVPATEDLVSAADIVVVPSIWGDACPSSVSEALASGKPLIASRAGGIPEIVGSGENAILVPPSDPERLAAALASLIRDSRERERLCRNARKRAEEALNERRYHAEVLEQIKCDLKENSKLFSNVRIS